MVREEIIILLPHTVRYAFLSATIPDAMQFAEWICKSHNQSSIPTFGSFHCNTTYSVPVEIVFLLLQTKQNEKGDFRGKGRGKYILQNQG